MPWDDLVGLLVLIFCTARTVSISLLPGGVVQESQDKSKRHYINILQLFDDKDIQNTILRDRHIHIGLKSTSDYMITILWLCDRYRDYRHHPFLEENVNTIPRRHT